MSQYFDRSQSGARRIGSLGASDPSAIGPFRLLGVLGSGGMGNVYLGQSPTGKRVAIKVIRRDLAEDPRFRQRFAREVAIARSVSALYTAPVVEADTDAEEPWFATAYIEGPSLGALVKEHGPMPPQAVLTLAAGLAEALVGMHRAGLVHRDLKPSNVLLTESGPHVIDFGIALPAGATRLTSNVMLGTPGYIAPERIEGDEDSPSGDIFSLGATLVFAATGHNVTGGANIAAQLVQMTRGRYDLTGLPASLRPLVVRCLARTPSQRPTAVEIVRTLVAGGVVPPGRGWFGAAWPVETSIATMASLRRPMTRRRVLSITGSVVVIGGAGGAGAWAYLRGRA